MHKQTLFGLLLSMAMVYPALAQVSPKAPVLRRFDAQYNFGTYTLEVETHLPNGDKHLLDSALKRIKKAQAEQHHKLAQLQEKARKKTTPIEQDTYAIFKKALEISAQSQGLFQISAEPLFQSWGFDPLAISPQKPTEQELKAALALVNDKNIVLDEVPPSLYFKNPQLQVATRYFEKGWLVHSAIKILRDLNIKAASVQIDNVGYYLGTPPDAEGWKVKSPHPANPKYPVKYFYLKNQALVNLGQYQNFFSSGGVRYSDLLNPQTGYPTEAGLALTAIGTDPVSTQLLAHATMQLQSKDLQTMLNHHAPVYVFKIWEERGITRFDEWRGKTP